MTLVNGIVSFTVKRSSMFYASIKVKEYSINVIEDSRVPLSAGVSDYSGIMTVVVLVVLALALIVMYGLWFRAHRKRITELSVMGIDGNLDIKGMDDVSIFHPLRTMRFENELENRVVEGTARGV